MLTKGGALPNSGLQMPFAPNNLMNGFNPNQFPMAPGGMPNMQGGIGGGPGANGAGMPQMANPMLTGDPIPPSAYDPRSQGIRQ